MSVVEDYQSLRVLIVDDDELMIEILSHFMEELEVGYITSSTSAEQALKMLAVIDPVDVLSTIVVCDLRMPGMDGVEFLRHLTGLSFEGGVILMSGVEARVLNTAEKLVQAHSLQLLGSLAKPFLKDDVVGLLNKFKHLGQINQKARFSSISLGDIRLALEQDEFQLYYQPKVNVKRKEVVGVESLIRWQHPRFGWVPPDAFIPIAEPTDLIDDITDMVISKALDQIADWRATGLELKVSVNISMKNLHQLDLPEKIDRKMKAKNIDPELLVLEITETGLVKHITEPLEILVRLRLNGLKMSIDDFGTGYSSLEQLKNFPFSELKIDRSFVANTDSDTAARAILESSVALGRKLDMTIVAEGVENLAEWNTVAGMGCDLVQGFWVARPMSGKDLPAWINKWNATH